VIIKVIVDIAGIFSNYDMFREIKIFSLKKSLRAALKRFLFRRDAVESIRLSFDRHYLS
jgi:hypothetical protein